MKTTPTRILFYNKSGYSQIATSERRQKRVIRNLCALDSMEMLLRLFPGILDYKGTGVPSWEGMDRPWDILRDDEKGIVSQLIERNGSDYGVFIHPSAIIGDYVRIEGPCYIGANAEIRHSAYLRKGSWICDGAVVGHSSEVKNSILLPNSKAPHFNYVGDSIIGFDANLGAGVKLSNVRNDRGEVPIFLENIGRIGSGLSKMGALIGDNSQLGCNVVTNPGAIIAPSSMIAPNETVTGWFGTKS